MVEKRQQSYALDGCEIAIERILFADDESGFCIARARTQKSNEEITIKGSLANPTEGSTLLICASLEQHPQFGQQYKVEKFKLPEPKSEDIAAFLCSGFIKGVGPVLAEAILKQFGQKTVDVFEKQSDLLLKVPGIGPRKYKMIMDSWNEFSHRRKQITTLINWGISPALVGKITARWPERTIEILQENPYVLATEIEGVGFATADSIAMSMDFPSTAPVRLAAAALETLDQAQRQYGHCFLSKQELIDNTCKTLSESSPQFAQLVSDTVATLDEQDKVYAAGLRAALQCRRHGPGL